MPKSSLTSFRGLVAFVFCLAPLIGLRAADQTQPSLVFTVTGPDGSAGSFSPREKPPANLAVPHPQLTLAVTRHDVHLASGKILSAIALESWKEGPSIRVKIWAMVPLDGTPNVYLGLMKMADLEGKELDTRRMSIGDTFDLKELKLTGLDSFVLKAGTERPKTSND